MRQLNARLVTWLGIAVEREVARVADDRLPVLELAHPQLGPLQIGQDGDGSVKFPFHRPNSVDGVFVVGMLTMAHVDAEGVHTGLEQPG